MTTLLSKEAATEATDKDRRAMARLSEPLAGDHSAGRVTVWFDADCPLCVREIGLMRRLDERGNIHFVAVQGAGDCPLDRATLLARLHARDETGNLLSGASAFAAMWRAIPLLRPLGIAAQWRPLLTVLELGYRGFLRLRPHLQRFAVRMGLK